MLGFVQNWIAPKANPIGVDFGSDSLRLVQVQSVDNDFKLIAAASADVPAHVRHDPVGRMNFFVETTRELLAQNKFQGRRALLGLPAASMFIQHLRVNKMDEEDLKKAMPWEARGKLPIDPSHAILRHLVAGEVYQEQEPKLEVIVMAAAREMVNQFLAAAAKARLDVVGMNVEPRAIVDCFSNIYRRKTDSETTTCYVDVGCTATRAVIARGSQIYFARSIPIAGDHFNRAVSNALKISGEDAKLLRLRLGQSSGTEEKSENAPAPSSETSALEAHKAATVDEACSEPLGRLVDELDRCRRYYEATFPSKPVNRLVFIGGESRHRGLCQRIAQGLGLAAQLGDPMVRMSRNGELSEGTIDRRQPQPAWAVAVGLSMGPAQQAQAAQAA